MLGKQLCTFLLAWIVVVGLSGCTTTIAEGPSPAVTFNRPETNPNLNNVALLDDSIAHKIEVQQSGAQRTPTDTLEVFVVFRNRTDYPLQIENRVSFLDNNGVSVDGPTAWKRVILAPNSIVTWKERSTQINVSYYYVEVREGR